MEYTFVKCNKTHEHMNNMQFIFIIIERNMQRKTKRILIFRFTK